MADHDRHWVPDQSTAPAAGPTIFGIQYQAAGGSPYTVLEAAIGGSRALQFYYNSSGTEEASATFTLAASTDYVVSVTVLSGSQNLYVNGVNVQSLTAAASNPHWTSTSRFLVGGNAGSTTNCMTYWAAAWNRALSAAEHAAVTQNIWQIFRPVWPVGILANQATPAVLVPLIRPVFDRTGSRRQIWAD